MGGLLAPTSNAQISGHRFLQRRVVHGIVMGDIRMIHEPLSARRRGLVFGGIAAGLGCLVAGALAIFAPQPDPGAAPLVRSEDGTHYVLVEDTYHPVVNLASAQLIVGENAAPARISDEVLAQRPKGILVGIPDAPSMPVRDARELTFAACHHAHRTTVTATPATPPVAAGHAVFARADGVEWIVTAQGRSALPPPHTPEGRAIRRAVGIHPHTPVWLPPTSVLAATPVLPPMVVPPLHTMITVGSGTYGVGAEGLIPLTVTQARILSEVGVPTRPAAGGEAAYINDHPRQPVPLPKTPLVFIDPQVHHLCVQGSSGELTARPLSDERGVELPSGRYVGPGYPVVAATGGGLTLVSDVGVAYPVGGSEAAVALGVAEESAASASSAVIELLPQGPLLERQAALAARF